MTAEIEEYESHEAWLARQHETLALIDETIANLPGGPPQPRSLDPLPWWKDENRINGEAQRALDGLHFAWEVAKAVLARLVWNRATGCLLIVLLPLALFAVAFLFGRGV